MYIADSFNVADDIFKFDLSSSKFIEPLCFITFAPGLSPGLFV